MFDLVSPKKPRVLRKILRGMPNIIKILYVLLRYEKGTSAISNERPGVLS